MAVWCGRDFKDTGKPRGCDDYKKRKNEQISLVYIVSRNGSNN